MKEKQDGLDLLAGYRVLDVTNEIGPLCGKILGDLGICHPFGSEYAQRQGICPPPDRVKALGYLNKRITRTLV